MGPTNQNCLPQNARAYKIEHKSTMVDHWKYLFNHLLLCEHLQFTSLKTETERCLWDLVKVSFYLFCFDYQLLSPSAVGSTHLLCHQGNKQHL